jgi:hypothetical protein
MHDHGAEIKREGAKHTIWFIPGDRSEKYRPAAQ